MSFDCAKPSPTLSVRHPAATARTDVHRKAEAPTIKFSVYIICSSDEISLLTFAPSTASQETACAVCAPDQGGGVYDRRSAH